MSVTATQCQWPRHSVSGSDTMSASAIEWQWPWQNVRSLNGLSSWSKCFWLKQRCTPLHYALHWMHFLTAAGGVNQLLSHTDVTIRFKWWLKKISQKCWKVKMGILQLMVSYQNWCLLLRVLRLAIFIKWQWSHDSDHGMPWLHDDSCCMPLL